jgi:hypothetical protein
LETHDHDDNNDDKEEVRMPSSPSFVVFENRPGAPSFDGDDDGHCGYHHPLLLFVHALK